MATRVAYLETAAIIPGGNHGRPSPSCGVAGGAWAHARHSPDNPDTHTTGEPGARPGRNPSRMRTDMPRRHTHTHQRGVTPPLLQPLSGCVPHRSERCVRMRGGSGITACAASAVSVAKPSAPL